VQKPSRERNVAINLQQPVTASSGLILLRIGAVANLPFMQRPMEFGFLRTNSPLALFYSPDPGISTEQISAVAFQI
jgi:hypothetical protein